MTRTFAIRIDARKHAAVARLARRRGVTFSDAVREALEAWLQGAGAAPRLPYAAVADLVGAVESPRPRRRSKQPARPPKSRR
jgi:hypothetical protein